MADLIVDITHIRDCAAKLTRVKGQFDSASDTIDSYRNAIGTSILSDKLHSFATNWKIHRGKLCGDLDTFAKWAAQAADAYDGAEDTLVQALRNLGGGGA